MWALSYLLVSWSPFSLCLYVLNQLSCLMPVLNRFNSSLHLSHYPGENYWILLPLLQYRSYKMELHWIILKACCKCWDAMLQIFFLLLSMQRFVLRMLSHIHLHRWCGVTSLCIITCACCHSASTNSDQFNLETFIKGRTTPSFILASLSIRS